MDNLEASYANAARRRERYARSKQCTVKDHGPCSPTGIRTAHPGPFARTTDLPPQPEEVDPVDWLKTRILATQ